MNVRMIKSDVVSMCTQSILCILRKKFLILVSFANVVCVAEIKLKQKKAKVMNVSVNINNEKFSVVCSNDQLQKCPVGVFLRKLSKYAVLQVTIKKQSEEKVIEVQCCQQGTKDLMEAARSICQTCVYKHSRTK